MTKAAVPGPHSAGQPSHRDVPPEMEAVPFFHYPGGQYRQADHRRQSGGKGCAEHPAPQRIEKQVIQQDVGKAARQHSRHGQPPSAVVTDKGQQDIVEQEAGGKAENGAQVNGGHLQGVAVRPHPKPHRLRQKDPRQYEQRPRAPAQHQGSGKGPVRFLRRAARLQHGVTGGPADAEHKPDAVEQAVQRDRQVEGGQTVRPQPVGHKKGIRQKIAGQPQHPQGVLGQYTQDGRKGDCRFHDIPRFNRFSVCNSGTNKKRPGHHTSHGLRV